MNNFFLQGDSGGPLSVKGVVYGIISFGSSKCELGAPGLFTRVIVYREWIRNYTGV